ncbi:MAG: hypothetical protein OEZ58_03520 [Gammaproteobacteria bacterium]|nr:hypothetical protein [Gammaproteobacteria bacterium]
MKNKYFGSLLLIMFLLSACGLIDGIKGIGGGLDKIGNSVENATRIIDNGIADIGADSTRWRNVLQEVATNLPSEISETIRIDAQNLVSRSVALSGAELRCNFDFLGARAIGNLQNLKAKLLGKSVRPLPPAFCQVVPDSIALRVKPERWETITLYGYDLDHEAASVSGPGNATLLKKDIALASIPLRKTRVDPKLTTIKSIDEKARLIHFYLQTTDGNYYPIHETRIGRTTHYQITLNVADLAKELYEKDIAKIVSFWGSSAKGMPEIVIGSWQPRQRRFDIPASTTYYMPPNTAGDADFHTGTGKHMSVDVRGVLDISDTSVKSRVYMKAKEERSDWTTASGWSNWGTIFTPDKGWKIVDVNPKASSKQTANIDDHQNPKTYNRPSGEVVTRFTVRGDRKGDDAGVFTDVNVQWRTLSVLVEEEAPEWLR